MSEFEQNWPVYASLEEHRLVANTANDYVKNALVLPNDNRWTVAYGALAMGDRSASVLAIGTPGTGKTEFGNIVMGERWRTDIAASHTADDLEGYLRPTDGELNKGKLPLNQDTLRFYLNEISHLRDTGPLHRYWDGDTLVVPNGSYDLDGASIYATSNFPDGRRVKELDEALRSRMGITVLAGDNADDIADKIMGRDIQKQTAGINREGLLPPVKARKQIREQLIQEHPLADNAGTFMRNTLRNLNETQLLAPIPITDNRLNKGWQQAERARIFIEDGKGKITPESLAEIAPLALGSLAILSSHGNAYFQSELGKLDRLTPLEQAVVARRVIAAVAFKTCVEMRPLNVLDTENMGEHMKLKSYAGSNEAEAINEVIIDYLVDNQAGKVYEEPKARSGSRLRRLIGR